MSSLKGVKNTYTLLRYTYTEDCVKRKLTVTIDEELLPRAKGFARSRGVSLSQLIEEALRELSDADRPSFSGRWRGRLRVAKRSDERFRRLAEKYL